MRRIVMLLICCSVIVSFVFMNYLQPFAAGYVYKNDSIIFTYTPSSIYYANLETNFPRNEKGSCAFTAISMLLSYYDSFYSDRFIPEQYDVTSQFTFNSSGDKVFILSSPGVKKEPLSSELLIEYGELLQQYSNICFQSFLINYSAGIGLNYIPNYFEEYGLLNIQIEQLISSYLYDYIGFDEDEVYVFHFDNIFFNEEDIREKIIDNILKSIPMIYTADSDDGKKGHCLIPYDYDEESDTIYFHTGWSSGRIISEDELEYTENPALIYILVDEANLAHSHTNNYVNQITGETVCACKFDFHPNHTHTFTGEYLDYNSITHTAECSYCNGADVAHNPIYTIISTTKHRATCDCGYTADQLHMAKRGENRCMACGALIDTDMNFPIIMGGGNNIGITASTPATYETYLSESGIIILSELDYNLFICGGLTVPEIYRKVGLNYD